MKKYTSTQFNQLLEYLYDLQRLGIKVGLRHTQELLVRCGNPHENFKSIHIAGTNGKGSTSAMLASILKKAGYRVGLYTSPHLLRFNERVRVNGVPISDDKIIEFVEVYKSDIAEIESTFFEATTALAFSYFKDENVDVAIVETGLGGRLDSTNVLSPKVTIITSITADHTEILGKDLKQIAFEKAGIIKNNTPLVLSEQSDEVEKVIWEIAEKRKASVLKCNQNDLTDITLVEDGTEFKWKGEKFKSGLIGKHQAINSILAIEATKIFDERINNEIINNGLAKVIWPGRMQRLSSEKPIYYDVAHNPHGIEVVIDALSEIFIEKPIGVIALKAEKELENIIPKIENKLSDLIVTSMPDAGLMKAEDLHNSLNKFGINSKLVKNTQKAFDMIEEQASKEKPGIIFGSHYIGKAVFEKFDFSFDNGVI
ncbi:MAG: folylpolyglutamate synthase/dihydrofolate synthase family protein [Draconibacterium sp.]|nr:folylpolyglutamate synthase/dihydrofolate synthase family protein [Draconibacterium sp.]